MTLVDNMDEAAMGSFVGLEFTKSAPFLILSVDRLMDVHGKFQGQVSLNVTIDDCTRFFMAPLLADEQYCLLVIPEFPVVKQASRAWGLKLLVYETLSY